ncbi:hypothetical protein CBR_g9157 [Chara braunii]|uniref:Uncharacterized protein n=1 Tax=Chara braunii TaxID=69332 RepID=A0A388KP15_CHABU|nr:hypothetical protein CBR_g9157 [Chara braunii]|eukprot:GBG71748.1 hypothetical protein CBR_g9157 [Chara braunii]
MQERKPCGDGIRRSERKELMTYTGGAEGVKQERLEGREQVVDVGMAGEENEEDSPRDIHDGALSRTSEDQQMMDHLILPLMCTLQGHKIFILGLRSVEDKLYMPTSHILEIPSAQFVMMKVRQLFAERFQFWLFPEEALVRLIVNLPEGGKARYSIPLVDARIPPNVWNNIGNVGLVGIPLRLLLVDPNNELQSISVDPGMSATVLLQLNSQLQKRRNLTSAYFAEVLSSRWSENLTTPGHIQATAHQQ